MSSCAGVVVVGVGGLRFGGSRLVEDFEIFGRVFLEILDAVLTAKPYEAIGFTCFLINVILRRTHVAALKLISGHGAGGGRIFGARFSQPIFRDAGIGCFHQ